MKHYKTDANSGQRRKRLLAIIAGTALLASIVAGCGSTSDESTNAKSAASPQESALRNSGAATDAVEMRMDSAALTSAEKPKVNAGAPASQQQQPSSITGAADATAARKIIYKANVTMEVADYGSANTEINNLIHLSGGYLLQFSENRTDYEQSGTLVVKVPAGGFNGFIADLEKMKPKTIQRSVQGQDVTEEFVDLDARLISKRAEEARLLDFMSKATKSDELVAFSSQIGNVQTQIEQIKGRMRYLEQNVAYSTIEIRLYQKVAKTNQTKNEPESRFQHQLSTALNGSIGVLLGFFKGLVIVLAAALPVLVVLAILAIPGYWIYRNRQKRNKQLEEHARRIRQQNKKNDEANENEFVE